MFELPAFLQGLEGHISGEALLIAFIVYRLLVLVAKKIPDDAKGPLGLVRSIAKAVTFYVENNKGDARA